MGRFLTPEFIENLTILHFYDFVTKTVIHVAFFQKFDPQIEKNSENWLIEVMLLFLIIILFDSMDFLNKLIIQLDFTHTDAHTQQRVLRKAVLPS